MEFREILERTIAAEGLSISVIAFIVWLAYWTGLALWHAARCGQTRRIALFHFVHTAELPELTYPPSRQATVVKPWMDRRVPLEAPLGAKWGTLRRVPLLRSM